MRSCYTSKSTCPADLIDWYFAAQRAYFTLAMKMSPCYVWTNSSSSWCSDRDQPDGPEAGEHESTFEHIGEDIGACGAGAVVGEYMADTYGFLLDETLVPEVLGPVAGCVVGVFGAELHGGDVVESAAATTGG